jgi:MYND finger
MEGSMSALQMHNAHIATTKKLTEAFRILGIMGERKIRVPNTFASVVNRLFVEYLSASAHKLIKMQQAYGEKPVLVCFMIGSDLPQRIAKGDDVLALKAIPLDLDEILNSNDPELLARDSLVELQTIRTNNCHPENLILMRVEWNYDGEWSVSDDLLIDHILSKNAYVDIPVIRYQRGDKCCAFPDCDVKDTTKLCGHCKIPYCSAEHQRAHWPTHKDLCKNL